MAETPAAHSIVEIPETLRLWLTARGEVEDLPDLSSVDGFSIRGFESPSALVDALGSADDEPPHGILLLAGPDLGRTVRGLRDRAPEVAVMVWGPDRDRALVAQALAAGAQMFSTDRRAAMLAPRIRDAVARQQRAGSRRGRLEARLEASEKERRRLTALVRSVAGALDRDLTALLGHLDQVFDQLPEASPVADHLDLIDDCGSRASELAQELAAYTGSRRVVPEPFDASELAEEMQVLLRACLVPSHDLTLNPGFNLPLVEADRALMRRLVVDLVLTTVQAPGVEHGKVTLSTGARECDRELLREILGGDGMRTGRFVYIEAAVALRPAAPDEEIDGLDGLESLLREHYGGLRVIRRSGRRLALQAFLPAFDRSSDDDVPLARGWHEGGSILLVEPNELARASVIPTLERLGFEVEIADDGTAALKRLDAGGRCPALVIVDADLSRPNTETVIGRIRERFEDAGILVSSGRGEAEVMEELEGLGVQGFLRKPFRVVNLRRIFRRVLDLEDTTPYEIVPSEEPTADEPEAEP